MKTDMILEKKEENAQTFANARAGFLERIIAHRKMYEALETTTCSYTRVVNDEQVTIGNIEGKDKNVLLSRLAGLNPLYVLVQLECEMCGF